jgi:hypothetical protein
MRSMPDSHLATSSRPRRAPIAWRAAWKLGLAGLLALAACRPEDHFSDAFLWRYATKNPSYANFFECHGYGCVLTTRIELTDAEWKEVRAQFEPPPADARAERRRIAAALVLMQRLVGKRTGTSSHQWSRSNYRINGNPQIDPTQLDCIDEAVNTWTYLTLFARDGLLRYHRVTALAYAGGLPDFDLDPRNTAVIQVVKTGAYFAIDPTLVDAVEEPPIFPLARWLGPWPPLPLDRDDPG